VASRNGIRTWKTAVSPGSYRFFSGRRSMRSWLETSNHQSSFPATQTSRCANDAFPSASAADAWRMTFPETGDFVSHASSPSLSVAPLQSAPIFTISSVCS